MKILGFQVPYTTGNIVEKVENNTPILTETTAEFQANFEPTGSWGRSYVKSFDGEKNFGEVGPIIDYRVDYAGLRHRSWQAYLTSDIAKTILDRFTIWIVGQGLKLEANPKKKLLNSVGVDFQNVEDFNEIIESRFNVWAKSNDSSYDGNTSFNELSNEGFKNSKVGGDVVGVLRYSKGQLTTQLIDGAHLGTPLGNKGAKDGNRIINGIEVNDKGGHVAYHIHKSLNEYQRIECYNKTAKLKQAFIIYGSKYRLDDNRGLPIISTSIESLKKIERYKEATLGNAEEVAKVAYQIVHQAFSDESTPFKDQISKMSGSNGTGQDAYPVDAVGNAMANSVAATTNKQALNMTRGSKVEPLNHGNGQLSFKEFYDTNANIICSSIGIPPNVAFSLYNDSFSASRAATKDWEHTISYERDGFTNQFYSHVYAFFLHVQVIEGLVTLPGYLQAHKEDNYLVLESYRSCRFTGPMFPHIDPLKEVKAERAKLGPLAGNMPLTTVEKSTEVLYGGNSRSNFEQFGREMTDAKDNGIEEEIIEPIEPIKPVKEK